MRSLTVAGLSADGRALLLTGGDETFAVAVADVHAAQQIRLPDVPEPARPAPSPREIQHRIRHGESAADIARTTGAAVEAVARYEGPALAEREHQARLARAAEVDGRVVADLVYEHLRRAGHSGLDVAWDSFLTQSGRWEIRATSGRELVRLSWDQRSRRINALDEAGRQALRLGPIAEDALGAVLRPLSARTPQPAAPERRVVPGRKGRAQVPGWDQISMGVHDRRPAAPAADSDAAADPGVAVSAPALAEPDA